MGSHTISVGMFVHRFLMSPSEHSVCEITYQWFRDARSMTSFCIVLYVLHMCCWIQAGEIHGCSYHDRRHFRREQCESIVNMTMRTRREPPTAAPLASTWHHQAQRIYSYDSHYHKFARKFSTYIDTACYSRKLHPLNCGGRVEQWCVAKLFDSSTYPVLCSRALSR